MGNSWEFHPPAGTGSPSAAQENAWHSSRTCTNTGGPMMSLSTLRIFLSLAAMAVIDAAGQTSAAQPAPGSAPTPLEQTAAVPSPLPALPEPPDSHVLDESGMLSASTHRALSDRLKAAKALTGLHLYLCVHTYLWGETADQRSSRTHSAWLGGQEAGVVVVHDRSTGRLSFAGSQDPRLPDADGLRALYRLADAAAKRLPPEATASDRLVATLSSLADGLESWQKNGQLPAPPAAAVPDSPPPAAAAVPVQIRPPWTRPAGFVVDEAGVFAAEGGTAALEQWLESWHQETGLRLYVVTVTFPPPNLPVPLADKLASEWLGQDMGGIIVYDRSRPDTLGFGGTAHPELWLSSVQLQQHHVAALAAGKAVGPKPADWLKGAASYLTQVYSTEGLPVLREGQQWLPPDKRRVLPWVLGGVIACAALLYLFQRWQERADRRNATVFLFPEVFVPERLGAPHGGGIAAESAPPPAGRPNAGAPTR